MLDLGCKNYLINQPKIVKHKAFKLNYLTTLDFKKLLLKVKNLESKETTKKKLLNKKYS